MIWDQTSIFDDDGNEHRAFTQTLLLSADVYHLDAALAASSFFSGDFGFSGRVLATFSINPVPLGHPLAMMAGAKALALGLGRRRLRAGGR